MSGISILIIISSFILIGIVYLLILLVKLRMQLKQEKSSTENINKTIDEQLFKFNQYQYQLFDNYQKQLNHMEEGLNNSMSTLKSELTNRLEKNEKANDVQLDKMRFVVEEKLHKTLEQRLGKSFELVNQSLLEVQKGLGEMQSLASGVGDLKKVLSNVKTRGILGEIQLGSILEQMLSQDQYGVNVATVPGSANFVEFAIKFPGAGEDTIWLPIDAKFPLDKYEQLVDAYEDGDPENIALKTKLLVDTVRKMANEINEKYIAPPHTTDFGILFLPVEGLYAELARDSALMMKIQREMKVMIAGPSNLAAFLTSLRMGFKTLAIEKRSSEVWKVLEDVKNEFWKFGEILAKTQKKLQEASNVIDKARGKTTTISRRLAKMEKLPESDVTDLLDDVVDVEELPK